jgi:hypothetical protein
MGVAHAWPKANMCSHLACPLLPLMLLLADPGASSGSRYTRGSHTGVCTSYLSYQYGRAPGYM